MFCNSRTKTEKQAGKVVAILVLVDSVLQYKNNKRIGTIEIGRNPCFSGQCFAIIETLSKEIAVAEVAILVLVDSVLQ